MRFRVNAPKVISETIDGEAVVINLDSGHYYSLEGSAGEIWGLVEQGFDAQQIVSVVSARHRSSQAEVDTVMSEFLDELRADELIVPADDHRPTPKIADVPAHPDGSGFLTPQIAKYTDLQHLIALDPIHDVDAGAGWPRSD